MKKFIFKIMIMSCVLCMTIPSFAKDRKLAQTSMKFLNVSLDAQASALSSALTSKEGRASCMFYNPAGMAHMEDFTNVSIGQVSFFADINYIYGAMTFRPSNGQYGVFGVHFVSVDYGELLGTVRAENEQGFLETGTFSPEAYAVGVGYSKSLTNKFSVGANIKYVYQNLLGGVDNFAPSDQMPIMGSFDVGVTAVDFGILYKTGFRSLNFGMSVRNFSQEVEYIRESFQLPLMFEIGTSINMVDFMDVNPESHSLFLSVDAVHPRDYAEQLDIGLEYVFLNTFALRTGYTSPTDEQGISLGAGFHQKFDTFGLAVDYSFTDWGLLDSVHRFTFNFSL